jgi:hypothetical protein
MEGGMKTESLLEMKKRLESRIEDIAEEIADLESERREYEDELEDVNDSLESCAGAPPCTPEEADGCSMCPPGFSDKEVLWVSGAGWLCPLCAWRVLLKSYREAA